MPQTFLGTHCVLYSLRSPPLLSPRASSHPSHVSPEPQYKAPLPPGPLPSLSPLLFVSAPARAPHRQRCRAPSHVAARSRIFYYEPARPLTSSPAPIRSPPPLPPLLPLPRCRREKTLPRACSRRALSYAAARSLPLPHAVLRCHPGGTVSDALLSSCAVGVAAARGGPWRRPTSPTSPSSRPPQPPCPSPTPPPPPPATASMCAPRRSPALAARAASASRAAPSSSTWTRPPPPPSSPLPAKNAPPPPTPSRPAPPQSAPKNETKTQRAAVTTHS